jgi:hypothetical protein
MTTVRDAEIQVLRLQQKEITMTQIFRKTLLFAGLSALWVSPAVNAQSARLEADIPFAFHAGGKVLPAGAYLLTENGSPGIFLIRNRAQKESQLVLAPEPKNYMPKTSKLVFVHGGNEYILSEISVAGSTHTNAVTPAGVEKNMTRKLGVATMISVPLRRK